LVCDSDPVFRTSLASYLLNCGAPVVSAASVREGIAALQHNPAYLVLSLVVTDGTTAEVVREAKRWGQNPMVVVVTSDVHRTEYFRDIAEFQPRNLFLKPIAVETVAELLVRNNSDVGTVYFLMSEENVRRQIALPWMTFGSDAGSMAPEGVFLESNPHPRAYGNFARLLGKYVRDERVIPLPEAIRRLTSMPAERLGIEERGRLAPGYHADVVVFDPATIADHATFDAPHQYSTGVRDVFVNGEQVLRDGEHTGALPGRFVRVPGYTSEEDVE
jgi:N-acyl-D-aspartate/D-glutamate deacylase